MFSSEDFTSISKSFRIINEQLGSYKKHSENANFKIIRKFWKNSYLKKNTNLFHREWKKILSFFYELFDVRL